MRKTAIGNFLQDTLLPNYGKFLWRIKKEKGTKKIPFSKLLLPVGLTDLL